MVTKALQSGTIAFFEGSVVKPARLSSNGKQSAPISTISCKNSISSAKPYVLTSNATGFQAGKKENSKMSLLPICVDGLTCAEEMKTCPPVTSEKLEEWMRDSVIEIVKHIQEAPFLHYVFDRKSPSASLKKQRDYADMFGKVDSWAKIRNSLRDISPDAVILVQKLNEDLSPESEEENVPCNGNGMHSTYQQGRTAVWGLLIQVEQIVKHIQEAPFLHYVFDRKSPSASLKKQRDYADMFGKVDSWAKIRNSLRDVSPDAVILVQKLNEDFSPESEEENVPCNGNGSHSTYQQGRTAVWGLLIQGRDVGVSACYVLKTTQIASTFGYCTSFCLTRAKCFGPTPHTQLTNSWLL